MGGIVPESQSKVDPCSPEKVKELIRARQDMAAAGNKLLAGATNVATKIMYTEARKDGEEGRNDPGTDLGVEFGKFMDYRTEDLKRTGIGAGVYFNHEEAVVPEKGVGEPKKVDAKGI